MARFERWSDELSPKKTKATLQKLKTLQQTFWFCLSVANSVILEYNMSWLVIFSNIKFFLFFSFSLKWFRQLFGFDSLSKIFRKPYIRQQHFIVFIKPTRFISSFRFWKIEMLFFRKPFHLFFFSRSSGGYFHTWVEQTQWKVSGVFSSKC